MGRIQHAEGAEGGEARWDIPAERDILPSARSKPLRKSTLKGNTFRKSRFLMANVLQVHWDEPERAMHAILAVAPSEDRDLNAKL